MTEQPERRKRRRVTWIVVLVVAVAAAVWLMRRGDPPTARIARAANPRLVPVVAATARLSDMPVYVDGLGTVTAIATVTVRSRVDGQLLNVNYREGQLVSPGDLLAEIDPRPFQVQLLQAQGQQARDEANLANARLDLQRYQTLLAQDSIPRQQLDTQVALVSQLEATIKSDQAQVESAKLNLVYCRITSPIAGRVGLRLVDPGNMVHASDPNGLVVVTQLSPIAVVFTIPADRLAPVTAQMRQGRRLAVEAWDRDLRTRLATGTLEAVDNQIDVTTGTVRLKATFSNEDRTLFSNQFVNARLLVDTLRGAVVVPTAALQRSAQGTFVWAVKPDSTVEIRDVDVQLTEGEQTAIGRGLQPGVPVVVEGVDNLQPGTKVASAPPGAVPTRAGAGQEGGGGVATRTTR
ncbi:MAG TPA: MdtA/MuxA family multidrug efflux RND transporter periplasmic adaptor subunit [Vicinamibacteria bacterium]|nr:MdtA/MuxA family multidrug efflux RND transporter periplasmic adaptor subunit [Vicinamibacteria bacterium]